MSHGSKAFLTLPKSLKRNNALRSSDSQILHREDCGYGSQNSSPVTSPTLRCDTDAIKVPYNALLILCDRYGDTTGMHGVHSGVYIHSTDLELTPGDKILFINEYSTARMSLPSSKRCLEDMHRRGDIFITVQRGKDTSTLLKEQAGLFSNMPPSQHIPPHLNPKLAYKGTINVGCPDNQGSYPSNQGSYPSSNQGSYPSNQGSYPSSNQGSYPSNQGSYSSNQGICPSSNHVSYPSNQGSCPSSNQGSYPHNPPRGRPPTPPRRTVSTGNNSQYSSLSPSASFSSHDSDPLSRQIRDIQMRETRPLRPAHRHSNSNHSNRSSREIACSSRSSRDSSISSNYLENGTQNCEDAPENRTSQSTGSSRNSQNIGSSRNSQEINVPQNIPHTIDQDQINRALESLLSTNRTRSPNEESVFSPNIPQQNGALSPTLPRQQEGLLRQQEGLPRQHSDGAARPNNGIFSPPMPRSSKAPSIKSSGKREHPTLCIKDEVQQSFGRDPRGKKSVRIIHVEKVDSDMGLVLAGGKGVAEGDILIAHMVPEKSAQRDGRLREGDEILMVNSVGLLGMTLSDATKAVKKLPYGPIRIVYCSRQDTPEGSPMSPRKVLPKVPEIRTQQGARPEPSSVQHDSAALEAYEKTEPVAVKREGINRSSTMSDSSGIGSHGDAESLNAHNDNFITITLVKAPKRPLGFTIVGGRASAKGDIPIYIKKIHSDGSAAADGRLQTGDEIVEVNGIAMSGKSHDEALRIFKGAKKGFLTLLVRPFRDSPQRTSANLSINETFDDGIGSISSESGLDTTPTISSEVVTLDFKMGMRLGLLLAPAVQPYCGYMEVADVKLDPAPPGATLSQYHVILKVNTRDMRNVPRDELLDILNGLVEDRSSIDLTLGLYTEKCRDFALATHETSSLTTPTETRRSPGDVSRDQLPRTSSVLSVYSLISAQPDPTVGDQAKGTSKPPSIDPAPPTESLPIPKPSLPTDSAPPIDSLPPTSTDERHIAFYPTVGIVISWDGVRLEDRPFVVEFTRDHNSRLGMTLCLNSLDHLAVKNIEPTGLIYSDGRLRSGDIVLAINSVPVSGLSFYQAAQLLRSCKNKVQLTVMNQALLDKEPPKTTQKECAELEMLSNITDGDSITSHDSDKQRDTDDPLYSMSDTALQSRRDLILSNSGEQVVTVNLSRKASQALGVTIQGGSDTPLGCITVKRVVISSPAAAAGVIPRDILLSVAGKDLTCCTHDRALEILKQAPLNTTMELSRFFGPSHHSSRGDDMRSIAPDLQSLSSSQSWNYFDDRTHGSMAGTYNGSMAGGYTTGTMGSTYSRNYPGTYKSLEEMFRDQGFGNGPTTKIQVRLWKGPKGLGFSVGGGIGTSQPPHIKRIYTSSPAHLSGRLMPGDIILSANGVDLSVLSHVEVVNIIRFLPQGEVALSLARHHAR